MLKINKSIGGIDVYFLLFLILVIILYVSAFKESFNEEKIQKVTPILLAVAIISFALAVLTSIMSS